jgi:hypothetical protein
MKRLLILLLLVSCVPQKKEIIPDVKLDTVKVTPLDTIISNENIQYNDTSEVLGSPYTGTGYGEIEYEQHPNKQILKNDVKLPTIIRLNNSKVLNTTYDMGNVVYRIPSMMTVRTSYQVLVRISKSEVNIYENLNGNVRTTKIPLTETMQVNLIDDSPSDNKSFDIIKDNDSIQIVDTTNSYTQWSWNVTPLRVGVGKLKVIISIIKNGNKKDIVYEDSVKIKMDLPKQIYYWFLKYWQWLFTSILIPFLVWLYKKIKNKKEVE